MNMPKVGVGALGLSTHASISRLDGIGGPVLLVSALVLPIHLEVNTVSTERADAGEKVLT